MPCRHLTALVAAGCGSDDASTDATVETPPVSAGTTTSAAVPLPGTTGDGFQLPVEGASEDNAFTYDEVAVPVGSSVHLDSEGQDGRTTVTFTATGLAPNVDPAASPESPSSDPAYANPQNEIWLDVTTDASGNAQSSTTVDWEFREGEANSVVLHAQHTMTGPGQAGMAGDRLACINEDF